MKTLYLECNMGAAGDMLMAALLELHDNPEDFLLRLNNCGIPTVVVKRKSVQKCGIKGTHAKVEINGEEESAAGHEHHGDHDHGDHHHNKTLHHISHLIENLNVSGNVKKSVYEIYNLIAKAESVVHDTPVDKIHFHEVGDMDALADITGVSMLMEELSPDIILASPVNTGSGSVRCAHGILPVPAPATVLLLRNVPIYSDTTNGELCTPTGAALLKYYVKKFCPMPVLKLEKTGFGMGKKDFEKANCIRAFWGSLLSESSSVTELVCNLDDMTPEALAFTQDLLLEDGALDVWTTPVGMKKCRAGVMLSCLCKNEDREKIISLVFKHTTTIGIREYNPSRYTLQREEKEIQTKLGKVRVKTSSGYGVKKTKYEHDDLAKIARESNVSLNEVLNGLYDTNSIKKESPLQ